jgi:threonyl-tRNA synthetase
MQDLKNTFSLHLQKKLRERYGKVPSCSVFARDFSLLAKDVEPISIETARKWIRGKALPHASRLRVLCDWLQIDTSFGQLDSNQYNHQSLYGHSFNGLHQTNTELLRLTEKLSPEEVEVLVDLVKIYIKKKNKR